MSLSIIDILFLVTVALLVINGVKNGALFSLINLLVLPIGFAVIYYFGPTLTVILASSGLPAAPLIAYAVLFIGTILILHIVAGFIRSVVDNLPLLGPLDKLLGAVIGFVEAWLIWWILLMVLGTFLSGIQTGTNAFPGVDLGQFVGHFQDWHVQSWYDFYNDAVNHSLFAQVNDFFVKLVPVIPKLPRLR
jgi:membrane protein required for colicin V production